MSNDPNSRNPFSDDPQSINPYASPPLAPLESNADQIRGRLKAPAVALVVLSIVSLPVFLLSLISGAARLSHDANADFAQVLGMLLPIISNVVILLGSIEMLRLRNYGSARTAAIIACIPLCTSCIVLGIPFGIWALVVLRQPETFAAFQSNRSEDESQV